MSAPTKAVLAAQNHDLRVANAALEAQIAVLRAELDEARKPHPAITRVYPLTDKLGRKYRLEGNVRCYPPAS